MTGRPWSAPGEDGRPRSLQIKKIVLHAALPAMLSAQSAWLGSGAPDPWICRSESRSAGCPLARITSATSQKRRFERQSMTSARPLFEVAPNFA